jgi:hypothetical protein
MALWLVWTVLDLPPLGGPNSEAAKGSLLTVLAIVGTVVFAIGAARYWVIFRERLTLLPLAVVGCFVLLSEALIGVAVTGERTWHASWWEWHGLIVTAYLLIGFAAYREWRDERFRHLYLPTTRQRQQEVSVLFSDLVGYTGFAERSTSADAAAVLSSYWGIAAPLITGRYGGQVEKSLVSSTTCSSSPLSCAGSFAQAASRSFASTGRDLSSRFGSCCAPQALDPGRTRSRNAHESWRCRLLSSSRFDSSSARLAPRARISWRVATSVSMRSPSRAIDFSAGDG